MSSEKTDAQKETSKWRLFYQMEAAESVWKLADSKLAEAVQESEALKARMEANHQVRASLALDNMKQQYKVNAYRFEAKLLYHRYCEAAKEYYENVGVPKKVVFR